MQGRKTFWSGLLNKLNIKPRKHDNTKRLEAAILRKDGHYLKDQSFFCLIIYENS